MLEIILLVVVIILVMSLLTGWPAGVGLNRNAVGTVLVILLVVLLAFLIIGYVPRGTTLDVD